MMKKEIEIIYQEEIESLNEYMSENFLTKKELAVAQEYLKDLRDGNKEKIAWYKQFGDRIRQKLMNINEYVHGLNFGYQKIELDNNGWLKRASFNQIEIISFKTDLKENSFNYLTIGKGENDKWTFSYHLVFGAAGCCSPLSVFNPTYESREYVIRCGVSYMKEEHQKALNHTKDSTNYQIPFIKKVLTAIEGFEFSQQQLTLF